MTPAVAGPCLCGACPVTGISARQFRSSLVINSQFSLSIYPM